MKGLGVAGLVVAGLAMGMAASGASAEALKPDDPAALARTRSLGDVIADNPKRPVHILYVHGMRAEGPNFSAAFREGLCRHVREACGSGQPKPTRRRFPLGDAVPPVTIAGHRVWEDERAWRASQPFVDRYVFERPGDHAAIVVDEVNWWPLLFPLKCRFILAPEARLSGPDRKHLKLCNKRGDPYYPWLSDAELAEALKGPRISGGGALANRVLKREILNFGLADATITLGPIRAYLSEAMEQAFAYATAFDGPGGGGDQEFVVVSESLGSFMVLDAARNELNASPSVQAVVDQTSNLYFFANQFALLELARVEGVPGAPSLAAGGGGSPLRVLDLWAKGALRPGGAAAIEAPKPRQVIAFNDPSDLLTYDVPKLLDDNGEEAAVVVNVYTRNTTNWLGLFANPVRAHTGASRNRAVLRQIFERSSYP